MIIRKYTEIIECFNDTMRPFLVIVAELPDGSGEVYEASDRRDAVRDFQKSVKSGQYKTVVLLRRPTKNPSRVIVMAQSK